MAAVKQRASLGPKSLYRQLLMGFGGCLIGVGLITLGLNYQLVRNDLRRNVQTRAQSIAQSLEFSTEGLQEANYVPIQQRVVQNYATLPNVIEVAIVDPMGQILAQGPNFDASSDMPDAQSVKPRYQPSQAQLLQAFEQASITGTEQQIESAYQGRAALTYFVPFSSPMFRATGRRGVAIVVIDQRQMQQSTWKIFITSTTTMAVGMLLIMLLIGWQLRRTTLRPLMQLNAAIADYQTTDQFRLTTQLPNNEIRFLAETFQQVFEQRNQVEIELRKSEAKERQNAQQLVAILQDLKNTQSQLIQTEKMAGLGQLVAGIAHEINNPTNFIHGNLRYAIVYCQDMLSLLECYDTTYSEHHAAIQAKKAAIDFDFLTVDLPRLLTSMQAGTERISDIVLSLKTFSHLDETDFKRVDIHQGLESTLLILQHRCKAGAHQPHIEIIRDYGDLPLIECYPSQLNQVFLHLVGNAIDALQGRSPAPSRRSESTQDDGAENCMPAAALAYSAPPPPQITVKTERQGHSCVVTIMDNGPGIAEKIRSDIFNPFFTTKPVGQGTGLGLSVSYQVIKNHGGDLHCQSTPGQGAAFVIELPLQAG
ncbi:sensor histidine kinase [filamentous cyanobacterium LEGE 11480]|uniref:histidine kinase n=1 Tax=Romeriopsis navalis LEGE 11480 TaxID=2777977 RepID=A0A928Z5U0_9CYAN|nr:ATP-binding protein [Romeriopsis navalis]MBE9031848.1 sensor histidine kinase [Romeriopsis navalis LEGE 11480]